LAELDRNGGTKMSKEADKRILSLVKPEYLKKIPVFVRDHATGNTCRLIEREHAELYAKFETEQVPEDAENEMRDLVNGIFEERMKKHHML
jgi:hypothetical protein